MACHRDSMVPTSDEYPPLSQVTVTRPGTTLYVFCYGDQKGSSRRAMHTRLGMSKTTIKSLVLGGVPVV